MPYKAEILLDSINPSGNRLTTFVITFPRFVLAEMNTHRLLSRNSASSRALGHKKIESMVKEDPFIPFYWGKNQIGMQAQEEIDILSRIEAEKLWIEARNSMIEYSDKLSKLGIHKQLVNRLLETWMYVTIIATGTEWENFFYLRCASDAQPEINKIAIMMKEIYNTSIPQKIDVGKWHLPFTSEEDGTIEERLKISTARCARVSYLTFDGKNDILANYELHDRLIESKHFSCTEHQAISMGNNNRFGNFWGWKQYRKFFDDEHHGRKLE